MKRITSIKNRITAFFRGLSKKQIIVGAIIILAVGGIAAKVIGGGKAPIFVSAERGTVEEEVLVTGKTVSQSEVDLGFERSGKVTGSYVDVGSKVRTGQTLVVLDQASLLADRRRAQADLDAALVDLEGTKRTSSVDFDTASVNAVSTLRNAFDAVDDAIRNKADQFFENPRTGSAHIEVTFQDGSAKYTFPINDSLERTANAERRELDETLDAWESSLANLNTKSDFDRAFAQADEAIGDASVFLSDLAQAINSISTTDFRYESAVAGYKSTVGSARTEVSGVRTDVLDARERLLNAADNGEVDENAVKAAEARIESLQADVDAANADISGTVLTAPISGVVTSMDAEKGEIVTSGKSLITIISDSELEVEANVSEVNIGKISRGDSVSMTFDAFLAKVYTGAVSYIDPGETVVDGVATYKVTVSFEGDIDQELKSGLTANLRIQTEKKDDIVKVPAYAVTEREGKSYVSVKTGEKSTEEREVTTGIRGKDGSVEILSGLEGTEMLGVSQ